MIKLDTKRYNMIKQGGQTSATFHTTLKFFLKSCIMLYEMLYSFGQGLKIEIWTILRGEKTTEHIHEEMKYDEINLFSCCSSPLIAGGSTVCSVEPIIVGIQGSTKVRHVFCPPLPRKLLPLPEI